MNETAKIFEYSGVKINYREIGEGRPVVFLHGFGASSHSWDAVIKHLSLKNKGFLVDLKGFGLSDKPLDDKYSAADQADIIYAFVRENNLKNLVLIGHSLGGAIGLLTYLKFMEDGDNPIKKMILIGSPAYRQRIPEFTKILRIPFLTKILFIFLPARSRTKMVLKRSFFDDKKITADIISHYGNFLDDAGSFHAFTETAKQILPKSVEEISAKYPKIKIPVLLIWGEKDQVISLSVGKRLEKDIPDAKLVVIPDCGHIPPEEKPQETAEIISEFLET